MELYQLKYFVEVAREQSFTRAARRLNLAIPALSLQIQSLEKELGASLLIRGRRQTVLTPAGEILFEKAQMLLGIAESVRQSVAEVSELRAGKLTIAFITALGTNWLGDISPSKRFGRIPIHYVLNWSWQLGWRSTPSRTFKPHDSLLSSFGGITARAFVRCSRFTSRIHERIDSPGDFCDAGRRAARAVRSGPPHFSRYRSRAMDQ